MTPHSHIRSIPHPVLRRRSPGFARIVRDRVQADSCRARSLSRLGRDVRAYAAVGFTAVAVWHIYDARAADRFAVDLPLEFGDGADIEVGGWGGGWCGRGGGEGLGGVKGEVWGVFMVV